MVEAVDRLLPNGGGAALGLVVVFDVAPAGAAEALVEHLMETQHGVDVALGVAVVDLKTWRAVHVAAAVEAHPAVGVGDLLGVVVEGVGPAWVAQQETRLAHLRQIAPAQYVDGVNGRANRIPKDVEKVGPVPARRRADVPEA